MAGQPGAAFEHQRVHERLWHVPAQLPLGTSYSSVYRPAARTPPGSARTSGPPAPLSPLTCCASVPSRIRRAGTPPLPPPAAACRGGSGRRTRPRPVPATAATVATVRGSSWRQRAAHAVAAAPRPPGVAVATLPPPGRVDGLVHARHIRRPGWSSASEPRPVPRRIDSVGRRRACRRPAARPRSTAAVGPAVVLEFPDPGLGLAPAPLDRVRGDLGRPAMPPASSRSCRAAVANRCSASPRLSSWNCLFTQLPIRSYLARVAAQLADRRSSGTRLAADGVGRLQLGAVRVEPLGDESDGAVEQRVGSRARRSRLPA